MPQFQSQSVTFDSVTINLIPVINANGAARWTFDHVSATPALAGTFLANVSPASRTAKQLKVRCKLIIPVSAGDVRAALPVTSSMMTATAPPPSTSVLGDNTLDHVNSIELSMLAAERSTPAERSFLIAGLTALIQSPDFVEAFVNGRTFY